VTAIAGLLDRLPRVSLIVGKGGVGKTTCAVGVAALFARRGHHTLLMSTDPAAALADVIGAPVETSPAPVPGEPNLDAWQLSAPDLRHDFLARWRNTLAEIVDRGTYLDRDDVDGLVDASLPGADEIFALLALSDALAEGSGRYQRIVVDTAPTGHTLRLLALPETFQALVSLLDLMQDKHRFMVRALTHRYRRDSADDFLDGLRQRIDALRAILSDERALSAVVVTRNEPVVTAETIRYVESLRALGVRIAAIIVNAATTPDIAAVDPTVRTYRIPRAPIPPSGVSAAAATVARATTVRGTRRQPVERRPTTVSVAAGAALEGLVRALTIVGGKGGVGKSTVACALSIAAVDGDGLTTLLVSTDPAPSIADALGAAESDWAHSDLEHIVPEVPGLVVRQMDASAGFARARDEYQSRIDAVFDAVVGRGVDAEHDRAVVRDLLTLAPPGIDELFALSILGDALADGRFVRIVVDPAPTGHLLRLLEMPAIAIDWSHRLMRLLLKYRDIVGLGDSAQQLLDFARRTRALDALLRDDTRSGVVIVSLDEPVVRAETERLTHAVRQRGLDVPALIWNRVTDDPAPLPAAVARRQLFARETSPAPIGVAALRTWSRSWNRLL
jgi:arsenite-transporting ATPase